MAYLKVGDIVTRKSYGGDINFEITDVVRRSNGARSYILKGLSVRIIADSYEDDLEVKDRAQATRETEEALRISGVHHMSRGTPFFNLFGRVRGKPGTILHIDSSESFLEMCQKYYADAKIKAFGRVIPESEQPTRVRQLLAATKADILIVTGHDGIKKNAVSMQNPDSYRHSRYFIQATREARKYEPDLNKLCIFAGACQSYFEGIMEAGANFASSPGRILIHALDPAKVGDRIALTDSRVYVSPSQIAQLTQSGLKGIGGIKTRGHYIV